MSGGPLSPCYPCLTKGKTQGLLEATGGIVPHGEPWPVSVDPEFRKRQIYGLLVVAVILLLAGLGRLSLRELFPAGWWRIW
jgi:hypothetical protein